MADVTALLLVALCLAGCAGTSARYYLACGPEFAPWMSSEQWPEPLCKNGPPR